MQNADFIAAGSLAAVAAIGALRWAWAQRKRSVPLNSAAWGLVTLAGVLGGLGAGAWGISIVALIGMAAAFLTLALAAARAPAGKAKASNRRVKMLAESGEPRQVGRRVATFVITVPLALLVSLGLAVTARALADASGASEADSITLAFFTAPLAWAILVHMLLIQQRRAAQWRVLLTCTLPILPVALTGMIS